jgi:hypothetical protein
MVISITMKKVDVRSIIGAVVVLTIIGAIVFGVFYFLIIKPAADALETSKLSAMSKINELSSIGTSQAISSASAYSASVQAATSKTEVESITAAINASIQIEQKRKQLLTQATTVTSGIYYSASGTGSTKLAPALSDLLVNLRAEINAKTTISELQEYEDSGAIYDNATATWRDFLNSLITGIESETLTMKRGAQPTYHIMSKTDALAYIYDNNLTWQNLSELDFEGTSYVEVPVMDTVKKNPTIGIGSRVKIYMYDTETDTLSLIVENAVVSRVLYSTDDIAMVAWTLSYDNSLYSYATNVWQAMLAAAAGSENAALVTWENYGANLINYAMNANLLNFDVDVVYVVKVPAVAGANIIEYEFYETSTKDVTLVLQTTWTT